MMRLAISMSAFSCTYTWHTPSASPRIGILVEPLIASTSPLLPLGITMSMCSSRASMSDTSDRVSSIVTASGEALQALRASAKIWWNTRTVLAASLEPLKITAFPLAMHRAATSGRTCGLASNTHSTTPRGTLSDSRYSPSASLHHFRFLPTACPALFCVSISMPLMIDLSFLSESTSFASLFSFWLVHPSALNFFSARAMSRELASRIRASLRFSCSTIVSRIFLRWLL
mmetsp:Transcript_46029/g.112118  ORF Transcript_46029/g.112118 Transcript_46029/m.112118 type:complete len:230 (+) Transcript_46029:805-1494(+)